MTIQNKNIGTETIEDDLIELRRSIHKEAENGFNEFKTKIKILKFIETIISPTSENFTIHEVGNTGIVIEYNKKTGEINENYEYRMIAMRAEMDALKMKENNKDLYYQSITDLAHMCGHDGHTVSLIYSIYLLAKNNNYPKNFKCIFIFQPAEEIGQGAKLIMESGLLNKCNEIYSIHNSVFSNFKNIYLKSNKCMAACSSIEITFTQNDDSNDLIVLASKLLTEIVSNVYQKFPFKDAPDVLIVLPSIIKESNNIKVSGSLRYFEYKLRVDAQSIIEETITNYKKQYNVNINLEMKHGSKNGIINNEAITNNIGRILDGYDISEGVYPSYTSDDFAIYTETISGCYFGFDIGCYKGHLHTSTYDFNDNAIQEIGNIWFKIIQNRAKEK